MQELGRGWQYTTYDLGNGRVLKKYNSLLRAYVVMFWDCLKFNPRRVIKIPSYFVDCKRKALISMQKVRAGILDPWMMGNPRVLNELEYEQDFMIPLHEKITDLGFEEGKEWVDKFVAFNKILIERSLVDKSFNITKNFGVDAQGRVVLMDLGELYSEKEAIDERRRKRAWDFPYVSECILNNEVRKYYIEQMDKNLGL